jgi:hypothetical protein
MPELWRESLSAVVTSSSLDNNMSSPFGCNKRNTFGNSKIEKKISPEPVMLVAHTSQVITLEIPFNTPAASSIRSYMHTHCVTDEPPVKKLFIYRSNNGWTNIGLDSTEEAPKLTADVNYTLKTAWRTFNECPHVSTFTMRKEDGKEFVYDDIDSLTFDPLPEATTSSGGAGASQTDAEVIMNMIKGLDDKLNILMRKFDDAWNKVDEPVTEARSRKRPA